MSRTFVSTLALRLALLCVLMEVLAGLGSRWGWWHFRTGFQLLTWAAYGGVIVIVVSLVGIAMAARGKATPAVFSSVLALIVAVFVVMVPWQFKATAQRVPPIHDITTDTENPPAFVAILPLRTDAPNQATYGGPEIAAQQRSAYPDLKPVILAVLPRVAFEKALVAAQRMGWEIVESRPDEGRIEATDTTRWFGFKDDVVIRVTPAAEGSRLDVRSLSRVGKSDVGTNARRIRRYLESLTKQ